MLGKLPPEVINRLVKEEQARLKSIDESKTMIRSFFSDQVNLGWQAVINVIQNILKKKQIKFDFALFFSHHFYFGERM